jgi:tRNA/tmRNA/rRNA uracil-C5-methylase (TrmA/RlmC/RlmD family)
VAIVEWQQPAQHICSLRSLRVHTFLFCHDITNSTFCRLKLAECPSVTEAHVIGRAKGCKISVNQDFVDERQLIHGKEYTQKQPEGTFSQPNGGMCEHMVSWASEAARNSPGDCLELYCGNGNFTIPLAQHFRQVVATEVRRRRFQRRF